MTSKVENGVDGDFRNLIKGIGLSIFMIHVH